jgi:hypothetical protein
VIERGDMDLDRVRGVYLQGRHQGERHELAVKAAADACGAGCREVKQLVAGVRAEFDREHACSERT